MRAEGEKSPEEAESAVNVTVMVGSRSRSGSVHPDRKSVRRVLDL